MTPVAQRQEGESPSTAPARVVADGIIDGIDLPIVVVDRAITLVRINAAARRALGLGRAENGTTLSASAALLPAAANLESLCAAVIAGGAAADCRIRLRDQWFLVRVTPLSSGEPVEGAVLAFTNVTALHAGIEQAIAEREFSKAVINAIAAPLLVLDASLRVRTSNRAFYQFFSVTREGTQDRVVGEILQLTCKADELDRLLARAIAEQGSFLNFEIECEVRGAGPRVMLISGRAFSPAPSADPLLLLSLEDVTDKKATEAALRESQRQAQDQAEALAELHRRKDEFLAMLSHELRNPLAPIVNSVLLLSLQSVESATQRHARQVIERQVGHLQRLIDDLLEVSRITTGRIRLHQERLAIAGVVRMAVDAVRTQAEQRRQSLVVREPAVPLWVHGDAVRLQQVVVNLLGNAIKYTPDGGRIDLEVQVEDGECVLRVADNGIGIPADLLPHVFDLFTQAQQSLDRSQGGLGIGLALVRQLVTAHGGRVEARSQPGAGSEFVVRLPLEEPPILMPEPAGDLPRQKGGLRILVVDDNTDMAQSMAALLRQSDHEVTAVSSAEAALLTARAESPDVVLMDIGLPGMDGYQLARRLRDERPDGKLVLVAITGYGQVADREQALDAGIDHHLVKPPDFKSLFGILSQAVGAASR
jgi:signal transduction histidine kinase/ActR/RegA family two-component response regulator